MYFNRKNAEQKNWRMIKKGKHFLFGCSLVFAVGAAFWWLHQLKQIQ